MEMLRTFTIPTLILALGLTLTACSGNSDQEAGGTEAGGGSRVSGDNAFSGQVRALERAEQVEDTLKQADQRRREQIDGSD